MYKINPRASESIGMRNAKIIVAPQAQLEESANDRSKPEEPISRVLMRTPGSEIGPAFGAFPEHRMRFE